MRTPLFLPLSLALWTIEGTLQGADSAPLVYAYRGFNSNSVEIAEGTLQIAIDSSNRVTGRWEFKSVNAAKDVGPQTGSGMLRGQVEANTVKVDLNPGVADNNIRLEGVMTVTNLTGTWGWYGFAGRIKGGKFEALRISTKP
jgi:hypothetical protein